MGQHKHPNDPNKRPTTHVTKRPDNYLSYGKLRPISSAQALIEKLKQRTGSAPK